jgi:hypothetical protein
MSKISEKTIQERTEAEHVEHPDDVRDRMESIEYAKRRLPEFLANRQVKLVALVKTYSDGDAEELLMVLREEFWARLWLKDGDPDKATEYVPVKP